MQQITATELQSLLAEEGRARPVLLDVREPWEFDVCHIPGSQPMSMRAVPARYTELDPDVETVVICHHGVRSFQVGLFLERAGFGNVINLQGGVAAWARDVDPAMRTY